MTVQPLDEAALDDAAAVEAADPGGMLRAVATSAAQVRAGLTAAAEAGVEALGASGRPRAVVVTAMGGSAMAGDVLAALTAATCPIPVVVSRGFTLPGWVGAADVVVALSCSGTTEETLTSTEEAIRRGAQIFGVGAVDSPLADLTERARGVFVPVSLVHSPRAMFWSVTTPVVAAAAALGLFPAAPEELEAAAQRLESIAVRCRPTSEAFVNPAKELAISITGSLPMAWGTSALAGVAAYRLACQWAENAKAPAVRGELPEAVHNQIVTFDGNWLGGRGDLFADPEETAQRRLHLLLLRDREEHPRVAAQADAATDLAREHGVTVAEVVAEGESPYERLASLIGLIDYTSVYVSLLTGIDPSPIATIDALKGALRAVPTAR